MTSRRRLGRVSPSGEVRRVTAVPAPVLRLRKDAYTPEALMDAGIDAAVARTLLADGPRAVPERPRVSLTGRTRAPLTTRYVWGPDALVLLADHHANHGTTTVRRQSVIAGEETVESAGPR